MIVERDEPGREGVIEGGATSKPQPSWKATRRQQGEGQEPRPEGESMLEGRGRPQGGVSMLEDDEGVRHSGGGRRDRFEPNVMSIVRAM